MPLAPDAVVIHVHDSEDSERPSLAETSIALPSASAAGPSAPMPLSREPSPLAPSAAPGVVFAPGAAQCIGSTRRLSHPTNLSLNRSSRALPLPQATTPAPSGDAAAAGSNPAPGGSLRERRAARGNSVHAKRLEQLTQLRSNLPNATALQLVPQATRRVDMRKQRATVEDRKMLAAAKLVQQQFRRVRLHDSYLRGDNGHQLLTRLASHPTLDRAASIRGTPGKQPQASPAAAACTVSSPAAAGGRKRISLTDRASNVFNPLKMGIRKLKVSGQPSRTLRTPSAHSSRLQPSRPSKTLCP